MSCDKIIDFSGRISRFLVLLALLKIPAPCQADVTAINLVNVSSTTYEATTTRNSVLFVTLSDSGSGDTLTSLTVENPNQFGSPFDAREPDDLVRVDLWLDTDGTLGTADDFSVPLGRMTVDTGQATKWDLTGLFQAVSDGQGLHVTVDVQDNTANGGSLSGVRAMRLRIPPGGAVFANAGVLPASEARNNDTLFLTTETPPVEFRISLSGDIEPLVGAGENDVQLSEWRFDSDPNPGHSNDAPTLLKGMYVYFRDASGTPLTPSSVVSALEVRDQFNVYMDKSQTGASYLAAHEETKAPGSLYLDLTQQISDGVWIDPSRSPELLILADIQPSLSPTSLRLEVLASNDLEGFDFYNGNTVTAVANPSFPLPTSNAVIEGPADTLNALFLSAPLPAEVALGETGIHVFSVVLENVGPPKTGKIDVERIHFTLWDAAGGPIPANTFLDRVVVRDAADPSAVYSAFDVRNDATSNTVTARIGFNPADRPLVLAAGSPVTVDVLVDLRGDAIPDSVKFQISDLSDTTAWKAIQFKVDPEVVVNSYGNTVFATAPVSIVAALRASHQSLMPPTVFAGEAGVSALEVVLEHPGPASVGDVRVDTLTFRLRDAQGGAVSASSALEAARLTVDGTSPAQSFSFAGDSVTVSFASGITLTPSAPDDRKAFHLNLDLSPSLSASGLAVRLASPLDVAAVQLNDPSRTVKTLAASGDAYPMDSDTASVQSSNLEKSVSNYPNPFRAGEESTTFSYFLETDARVTIRIFTLTGEPVRTVVDGAAKSAGSHQEDAWDGRNSGGRTVLNGIYVAVFEFEFGGDVRKVKRLVAVKK